MSSVTIIVAVDAVGGNGLPPPRTTFEFHMFDIDTSIDDVDVNTLSAIRIIFVYRGGGGSRLAMTDTSETLFEAHAVSAGIDLMLEGRKISFTQGAVC